MRNRIGKHIILKENRKRRFSGGFIPDSLLFLFDFVYFFKIR